MAVTGHATKTYMVSVESEGLSADWLDDVIVVAKDEDDARLGAEQEVLDYRRGALVKETEVYELATEHPAATRSVLPTPT